MCERAWAGRARLRGGAARGSRPRRAESARRRRPRGRSRASARGRCSRAPAASRTCRRAAGRYAAVLADASRARPLPSVEAEKSSRVIADQLAQIALAHAKVVQAREQLLECVDRYGVVHLTEIAADARAVRADEIDP